MNEVDTKNNDGKLLQKTKPIYVIILLSLCVACLLWGLYSSQQRQKEMEQRLEMYRNMELTPEDKPDGIIKEADQVITSDTVNEQLNSLGELVTVEYLYTNADKYENQNQVSVHKWNINLPFTTKSFLLAYDGRIKAGVDLQDVQIDIDENSHKITVILPKSEITSHEISEDDIRVFDEKDSVFNKITIDNYNDFVASQKDSMEQRAIDMGLLTSADENAKTVVYSFLSLIPGMDAYSLTIK